MARPVKLNSIVENILKDTESKYPDNAHKIWDIWAEAVGHDLATRCSPLALSNGKLTVAVESPIWLQQLSLFSAILIENINRLLDGGYVKKVVFKQADIRPPALQEKQLPEGWEDAPLASEEIKYIEDASRGLKDEELSKAIKKLIAQALRRARFEERQG
ncbi:MAG: hypothetical protein C0609_05905 [Deltaproteobacteria bacterium]|nr:MAG: hypothetical protein C0609_05905 [Deltaproteobacteria bacterium]